MSARGYALYSVFPKIFSLYPLHSHRPYNINPPSQALQAITSSCIVFKIYYLEVIVIPVSQAVLFKFPK